MSLSENTPYQAYLLRCWRTENNGLDNSDGWRFVVEEVADTRRRVGFTSLEELTDFLHARLDESAAK